MHLSWGLWHGNPHFAYFWSSTLNLFPAPQLLPPWSVYVVSPYPNVPWSFTYHTSSGSSCQRILSSWPFTSLSPNVGLLPYHSAPLLIINVHSLCELSVSHVCGPSIFMIVADMWTRLNTRKHLKPAIRSQSTSAERVYFPDSRRLSERVSVSITSTSYLTRCWHDAHLQGNTELAKVASVGTFWSLCSTTSDLRIRFMCSCVSKSKRSLHEPWIRLRIRPNGVKLVWARTV